MILATRYFEYKKNQGLQIHLQKKWTQNIGHYAEQTFKYFDNTLIKLDSDPEATKTLLLDYKNAGLVSKFETARGSSLQSLSGELKKLSALYTLYKEGNFIIARLPSFLNLIIESKNGDFYALNYEVQKWSEIEIENDDIFAYLIPKHFSPQNVLKNMLLNPTQKNYSRHERFSSFLSDPNSKHALKLDLRHE